LKLESTLFSIPSAKLGYRGAQPIARNFALLTRLLVSPRLRALKADLPMDGIGRFNFAASQQ